MVMKLSLSLLVVLSFLSLPAQSFSPNYSNVNFSQSGTTCMRNPIQSTTQLNGLFGNVFGKKEEEEYDPSVPTRVIDIKCDSIKIGGLRMTLGLFLIGQQGTPVKGSWKINPASDGVLDMYYVDKTSMFSLHLTDELIFVDRYGRPSLQYQLQESLILHRFLDELNTLAFEGDEIEDENRLLVFSDPENAIEDARGKLPARIEG